MINASKIVALSGGVGGAKLSLGLSNLVPGSELIIVVNTGDDFDHHGLRICPDLDTMIYTLSGINDQERGWGRRDETWTFMSALKSLGGNDWFNLGDGDLALHVLRTEKLRAGLRLSDVIRDLCKKIGIEVQIVPMTNNRVSTLVRTVDGTLPFQNYFVQKQCFPEIIGFTFKGLEKAVPDDSFLAAVKDPQTRTLIITPSNPFVSIDPILKLKGIQSAIKTSVAPVIAVSPIVGGKAIKGPAAKMFREIGITPSAKSVALHYKELLDGIVIDKKDENFAAPISDLGIKVLVTDTVMMSMHDRTQLAREVLDFAAKIDRRL